MNRFLQIQSNAFFVIAMMTIAWHYMVADKLGTSNLFVLILLIAFFGVPHGSLDALFAKKAFALITRRDWFKFVGLYLCLSMAVLIFWLRLPTIFFVLFLGFSALHFSDDISDISPKLISFLYGCNIILLPSILHSDQLALLYGYLIDNNDAIAIVRLMRPFAMATMLLSALLTVRFYLKKQLIHTRPLLEITAVSLLVFVVKPLLAFTIYFCFMHSARHLLRAKFYFKDDSNKHFLFTLILPTLFVLIFCVGIFQLLPTQNVDENLVKVTFAALAALTFPHAFLLSKVGFLKWLKSSY